MVVIVIVIILYYIIFNIRSLRTANSWSESRDVFNEEANRIRAEFDQNKSLDAGIYIYIIPSVQIISLLLFTSWLTYIFWYDDL